MTWLPVNFDNKKVSVNLIFLIAILQMISITGLFDLSTAIAILGILILFFAYNIVNPGFKKMSAIFIVLSIAINLHTNQPLTIWIAGVNNMLNITAILVVMQIFTIPIKLGEYERSLEYMMAKVFKKESSLYFFTMCIIHLFSSFLLFATIPVMLSLMGKPLQKITKDYKRFACTALSRSYSFVVLWAPGAVNILLLMEATGVTWMEIFPLGFFLAILGILLSVFMEKNHLAKESLPQISFSKEQTFSLAIKKIIKVLLIVTALIILIVFLDCLHFTNNTNCVMLAGLIVAVFWLLTFIKNPFLKQEIDEYFNVSLAKIIDLSVLFIAMGMFSKALAVSGILLNATDFIRNIATFIGAGILFIIPLTILFSSLIGVHPYISMGLLGKILVISNLPFSVATISSAILVGGVLSYMLSPFAAIVLTTAKFIEVSPYTVGIKYNGFFCFIYFIISITIVYIWDKAEYILSLLP